ncbi:MAG TPA: dienelactone hydrolase family protein [Aldersonia sp.]
MNDALIRPTRSLLGLDDGELPVLEITLGGTPRGIVLVACDGGSATADASEIMNRLAEHGYESIAATVAPDESQPAVRELFARAADRGWTPEQTGMVGCGSGGRVALDAASTQPFGAAVSLSATGTPDHPVQNSISASEFEGRIATPWLGLFGSDDPDLPAGRVRELEAALDRGTDVHTMTMRYPGVGREFYRHGEDGLGYGAWYDGWQRTVEWLNARIAPRLTPLAQQWRQREFDRREGGRD